MPRESGLVRNGSSFGSFVDGLSRERILFTRELCRRVASRRSRSFVHFGHDTLDGFDPYAFGRTL
jgi:hypothetical protein